MASTPPLQIVSTPQTPATPLHGAAYDRRPTRTSSRIAARHFHSTPDAPYRSEAPVTTPKSSRQSRARQTATGIHSPESTPRNQASRRVQVISPSSPNTDTHPPKPMPRSAHLQPFASSSTTISDGMLPTPVKTPKKKVVNKASKAARALFQDNSDMVDFEPSPRKVRRGKRYNGFSLESFSAENEGGSGQIQIYTDSRDRVPHIDGNHSNPFVEHDTSNETSTSRKVAGTSKRRKVSGEKKKVDSQVAAAIEEDDGMVYVFRGKKVYRRFDDEDDEEQEIDDDDLGLLEHSPESNAKSLKTLTRRSIKPKRLFQTEAQKKARRSETDEEALTDIEESNTLNGEGESSSPVSSAFKTGRSLRSTGKVHLFSNDSDPNDVDSPSNKKTSPFDTWPRLKSGGGSSLGGHKGRKRSAPETIDDLIAFASTESKKTRT